MKSYENYRREKTKRGNKEEKSEVMVEIEKLIRYGTCGAAIDTTKHRKSTLSLPPAQSLPPPLLLLLYTHLPTGRHREDTMMLVVDALQVVNQVMSHQMEVPHDHGCQDPPPCSLGHQPLNTMELPSSNL